MSGDHKPKLREEASARQSISEQLDRTLSVAPARGWTALLAILAAVAAVAVWSVVGRNLDLCRGSRILVESRGQGDRRCRAWRRPVEAHRRRGR